MSLPDLIRRAREAAGISQRDLARQLGVHHSAVWQWEDGQSVPDIGHRIELSAVLDIRFTDLLPEARDRVALVTEPNLVAIVKLIEPLSVEARGAWLRIISAALDQGAAVTAPVKAPARRRAAKAD